MENNELPKIIVTKEDFIKFQKQMYIKTKLTMLPKLYDALSAKTWERHGITSRPTGANYCLLVLDTARSIAEAVTLNDITPEVLDGLTWDNYHTAREAVEIVRDILRKETPTA